MIFTYIDLQRSLDIMHYYNRLPNDPYWEFEPEPLYLPLELPEEPLNDQEEEETGRGVIIIEMFPED